MWHLLDQSKWRILDVVRLFGFALLLCAAKLPSHLQRSNWPHKKWHLRIECVHDFEFLCYVLVCVNRQSAHFSVLQKYHLKRTYLGSHDNLAGAGQLLLDVIPESHNTYYYGLRSCLPIFCYPFVCSFFNPTALGNPVWYFLFSMLALLWFQSCFTNYRHNLTCPRIIFRHKYTVRACVHHCLK